MFELGSDGPSVILVGIDGSRSSLRAGAYAAGLARRQRSLLVIAYIQPVGAGAVPQAAAEIAAAGRGIADDIRAQIHEALDRLPADAAPSWEFRTRPGDPYGGLVKTAEEVRAEALVIGASEQAGHRILGSVGVRLVKSGRWPVTVVP
ncbi:MAG TPA: universal stress protein [Actinospica sp.]|nr:universal stress protein [Actinospica sp.]